MADETKNLLEFIGVRDAYTRRHSERVGRYAVSFAEFAALSVDPDVLHTASLLHDVGKLSVPLEIIRKTSQLTVEEFSQMQEHSMQGWGMLRPLTNFRREAEVIRHHHERWDGGGYPDGLVGEKIPFSSRIIHIIDAVDVMLTPRTYKKPYPTEWVISELLGCSGTQFDPHLTQLAVDWVNVGKIYLPHTTKAA